MALSLMGLFLYALSYVGMHQLNNPAQLVEDCALVDHHLHQNPNYHSCDLCVYYTPVEIAPNEYPIVEGITSSPSPDSSVSTVCLNTFNLSQLRAPPIS